MKGRRGLESSNPGRNGNRVSPLQPGRNFNRRGATHAQGWKWDKSGSQDKLLWPVADFVIKSLVGVAH